MRSRARGLDPWTWAVGGLVLVALALRLGPLGQSMFGDELFLYAIVHDRSAGDVLHAVQATEKTPPLGFLLSWAFDGGGHADVLVRVPSLVANLATVPLVYVLAKLTVGRAAGFVAAAWTTLSAFQIFYATESRGYALAELLVVLSTVILLVALERRALRWWLAYALVAAAAAYTHYIVVFVLVPQAAWALWTHRDQARRIVVASGLAVLAYLPWIPGFLEQARHSSKEAKFLDATAPTTLEHVSRIASKALAGHPFLSASQFPGRVPFALLLAAPAAAAVVLVARRTPFPPALRRPVTLLALLALTPLVGQILYSLRPDTSFLVARNLIISVPYALVLIGLVLTAVRPPALAIVLSAAALAGVAAGTVDVLRPKYQRADARDAAEYIDRTAPRDASVVNGQVLATTDPPSQAVIYYLRGPQRRYQTTGFAGAWATAARRRAPVLVASPNLPVLAAIFKPPRQYRSHYRLASEHTTPGLAGGFMVRTWVHRDRR